MWGLSISCASGQDSSQPVIQAMSIDFPIGDLSNCHGELSFRFVQCKALFLSVWPLGSMRYQLIAWNGVAIHTQGVKSPWTGVCLAILVDGLLTPCAWMASMLTPSLDV